MVHIPTRVKSRKVWFEEEVDIFTINTKIKFLKRTNC